LLAAPFPEPVRKAFKVLFPDLVENCPYRVLCDFVFQRRDPQRSLPSVGFQDVGSQRRFRPISPAMDAPVQVGQPPFQVVRSILFPRHPIHSRGRLLLQAVVTFPQQVDAYVVQQGCEL
jgi:hypothetical protein